MRIPLVPLLSCCFIMMAAGASNADDAKPHWRVFKAHGEPVVLVELDGAGETIHSEKLLKSSDEVQTFAFNDGQIKLAISTIDRKIRVWNLAGQEIPPEPLELLSPEAAAVIVQVSPDGKWVASGDKRGNATLWELRDNESKVYTLRQPWLSHPIAILKFSSDSRWLFSASNDTNKYRYFGGLWKLDQRSFSNNASSLNANVNAFSSAFFAPGGRWFVTGHNNATWIWDLKSRDPSKNPVTVRRKEMQKGDVQLADGIWKTQHGRRCRDDQPSGQFEDNGLTLDAELVRLS